MKASGRRMGRALFVLLSAAAVVVLAGTGVGASAPPPSYR